MRIVKENEKEGIVEVVPETLDDLWHLSHIIEVGDNASSRTTRRIQDTTGDKTRGDRGVKKTFYLGLDIKNISFHLFTGKLRLTGVITKGPEDLIPLGSHHTLEVKLNVPLKITKSRWPKWAIKRINQAIEASKKLSAIIVVLEDDTATLGLMRQFGIEYYGPIKGHVSGKRIVDKNRQKNIIQFYEKVIESIVKFDSIQRLLLNSCCGFRCLCLNFRLLFCLRLRVFDRLSLLRLLNFFNRFRRKKRNHRSPQEGNG